MFRPITCVVAVVAAIALAGCGGGAYVGPDGIVFTGYVTVAPVYVTVPVTNAPASGFPSNCIVANGGNMYTLYGYGYYGCPQLSGRDLVYLFESAYPSVWVDSWSFPSYGTARITIR